MYHVTCRVQFDAGHRLLNYDGPCSRLHGHRYVAEVTVEGRSLDDLGMLVDFGVLKTAVKEVITLWDHRTLLHSDDPLTAELPGDCLVLIPGRNPTSEVMAASIYRGVKDRLPAAISIRNVRLFETPDCWCDYAE